MTRQPQKSHVFFLIVWGMIITQLLTACVSEETAGESTTSVSSDALQSIDTTFWRTSDGWSNGTPFLNGWCAENIKAGAEGLNITLETRSCSNETYASGEYRSNSFYGYSRIEVEMKAASGAGVVSSLFFYTGHSDGTAHEEIDVEILGMDPSRIQVNYWTEESNIEKEHPTFIDLGFDASADYHSYAIEWSRNAIKWYADDKLIHIEDGSKGNLPTLEMHIFMNLWACNANTWCGSFSDAILPVFAKYRNFRLSKY